MATGTKRLQVTRTGNMVTFLAFLPDGRTLLESRANGENLGEILTAPEGPESMRFLDAVTGMEQPSADANYIPPPFYRRAAGSKCLSLNGKLLALNSGNAICIWDVATGREVGPARGIHFSVEKLVFSPDGKKLATLAAFLRLKMKDDKSCFYVSPELQLWETETGRIERELELLPRSGVSIASVRYSDDRHLELLFGPMTTLSPKTLGTWCWNIENGSVEKVKKEVPTDLAPVLKNGLLHCCAVSSDRRWQALGFAAGITLVNAVTSKEKIRLFPRTQEPNFATFSSDGQTMLAYVGNERQPAQQRLQVWSVATGKMRLNLPTKFIPLDGSMVQPIWPEEPHDYALSPDGRWLAVAQPLRKKKAIRLLEVASGIETEGLYTDGAEYVTSVAWSPDGRFLAGGDNVGSVRLWDVVGGRQIRHFSGGHRSSVSGGHRSRVSALAFSPDGLRLASGSYDATGLIWDLQDLPRLESPKKNQPTEDVLWAALAGKDPAAANRSIHLLTQMPDVALPLLRERLRPASVPDTNRVVTLLTRLDDDNFQVRKQAEEQLEKMGEGIEPLLQDALAKASSPEVRRHIMHVLDKVLGSPVGPSGLNCKRLQTCRGVEVLERIGTPSARQVLEELSRLPSGLIQEEEAKAALYRLTKTASASVP